MVVASHSSMLSPQHEMKRKAKVALSLIYQLICVLKAIGFMVYLVCKFSFYYAFLILNNLELYGREEIKQSTRISNPGCYATNSQLLLAPLLPYLKQGSQPTVFGMSGYSGAGTKTGEKDANGIPVTLPKIDDVALGGACKPYAH